MAEVIASCMAFSAVTDFHLDFDFYFDFDCDLGRCVGHGLGGVIGLLLSRG